MKKTKSKTKVSESECVKDDFKGGPRTREEFLQQFKNKFAIGDRVRVKSTGEFSIVECLRPAENKLFYQLHLIGHALPVLMEEDDLEFVGHVPIIDRIKTVPDACGWCLHNGHGQLAIPYEKIPRYLWDESTKDMLAYIELRMIVCALNEGWAPTNEEWVYYPMFYESKGRALKAGTITAPFGPKDYINTEDYHEITTQLFPFKTAALAKYAGEQFLDVFADLLGFERKEDFLPF